MVLARYGRIPLGREPTTFASRGCKAPRIRRRQLGRAPPFWGSTATRRNQRLWLSLVHRKSFDLTDRSFAPRFTLGLVAVAVVDRVYKGAFSSFRAELEDLRAGFVRFGTETDWTHLRIEPLLKHIDSLENILKSKRFAGEVSRLRRGVAMFHSDLVYLRLNVRELRKILALAQESSRPKP